MILFKSINDIIKEHASHNWLDKLDEAELKAMLLEASEQAFIAGRVLTTNGFSNSDQSLIVVPSKVTDFDETLKATYPSFNDFKLDKL